MKCLKALAVKSVTKIDKWLAVRQLLHHIESFLVASVISAPLRARRLALATIMKLFMIMEDEHRAMSHNTY